MSLFLDHSVPELRGLVARRELACSELAEECIRVYEATDSHVRAWTAFDATWLRQAAAHFDQQLDEGRESGLLGGVPFAAKDIFNTRAFPTEMGSPVWKGFRPGNNARVVDALIWAGALVAGKTVTAEFAVHHLNETINPFDAERTPGTSSSGSAVAVAVGAVPFALGTQTAGSIVRPASFCGVWGFKPSFGLVPRTGVLKTTDSLDTVGVLASHVDSLRPLLDCIRVKGPDYPFVHARVDGHPYPHGEGPWRVGLTRTYTWGSARDYAQDDLLGLAGRIAAIPGWEVEEVDLPDVCLRAHDVHATIYNKCLAYYFEHESKVRDQISPIMAEMIEAGRDISPEAFRLALREQERIAAAVDAMASRFDVLLSLGTGSDAPPRGVPEVPDPSLIWTLAHVPSVAVPAFTSPAGLPYGCQFLSGRYRDYLLLEAVETLAQTGTLPSSSRRPGHALQREIA